jgi:uncharacterized protein DUF397
VIVWRRSSRCESASCVEVSSVNGRVAMRDSKLDESPVLTFDVGVWTDFTDRIRAGELDAAC